MVRAEAEEKQPEFFAIQVKEKFGGLRFYLSGTTKEMLDATQEAQRCSYEICEKCGAAGCLREGNWLRVLCDSCTGKAA